jgi:hypothetical protein
MSVEIYAWVHKVSYFGSSGVTMSGCGEMEGRLQKPREGLSSESRMPIDGWLRYHLLCPTREKKASSTCVGQKQAICVEED